MKFTCLLCLLIFHVPSFAKEYIVSGIQGSVHSEISYQVLKEAYESIGHTLKWRPFPAERSLRVSNDGHFDGELFRILGISKRYNNLLRVPTRINILQGVAYSHDPTTQINGWSSLRGKRVGVQIGVKFVESGTQNYSVTKFETNQQLFNALDSKRIDIAVVSRVNGIKTLRDNDGLKVEELFPVIQEYDLFHYIHKKNQQLISPLNKALLQMKVNGRIKKIREEMIKKLEKKD